MKPGIVAKIKAALGDSEEAKALAAELEGSAREALSLVEAEAQRAKQQEQSKMATEAELTKQLAALQAKLAAAESAAAAAEAKRIEAARTSALKTAAAAAGIVDLDALAMFDASKLELADDGTLKGVDSALAKFREAKPFLFKAAEAAATEGAAKGEPAAGLGPAQPAVPGVKSAPRPGDKGGAPTSQNPEQAAAATVDRVIAAMMPRPMRAAEGFGTPYHAESGLSGGVVPAANGFGTPIKSSGALA